MLSLGRKGAGDMIMQISMQQKHAEQGQTPTVSSVYIMICVQFDKR